MKRLLMVYHSQSGATAALAQAVASGIAQEEDVELRIRRAFEADTRDLLWAQLVIFGSPENFGYLSGGLTDFLARTYYPALPLQLSLPYAVFISAGNDGTGAVRMLERIVSGYPLQQVIAPLIVRGEPSAADLKRCLEFGLTLAAGLAMGIY